MLDLDPSSRRILFSAVGSAAAMFAASHTAAFWARARAGVLCKNGAGAAVARAACSGGSPSPTAPSGGWPQRAPHGPAGARGASSAGAAGPQPSGHSHFAGSVLCGASATPPLVCGGHAAVLPVPTAVVPGQRGWLSGLPARDREGSSRPKLDNTEEGLKAVRSAGAVPARAARAASSAARVGARVGAGRKDKRGLLFA